MAIALRGSGPVSSFANNGGDVTINLSGLSLQENDVVVAAVAAPKTTGSTPAMVSSGWTEVITPFVGTGSQAPSMGVWYKRMGASPDSSVVMSGDTSSETDTTGIAIAFSGVNTSTALDQTAVISSETTSTNPDPSTIVTQTDGAEVIVFATSNTLDTSITVPSGYSNHLSVDGNDTYDHTQAVASKNVASAGSENPPSWTNWSSGIWRAVTLALKPAASNTPPSVALNSPSDTATGVSVTPDLTFTGTDSDGDDIRYNVQIDTVNTFDSQSGSPLRDKVSGTDVGFYSSGSATTTAGETGDNASTSNWTIDRVCLSQMTTGSNSGVLNKLTARIWVGGGSANVRGVIYTDSGGSPSALFAYGDEISLTATSEGAVDLPFSGAQRKTLAASTNYWIGYHNEAPTGGNTFNQSRADTASQQKRANDTYSDGAADPFSLTGDANGKIDCYATYTIEPFDSGQQATYTVQTALNNSTLYYWRARGIDPTGTNTYGSWATTRSFTTEGGGAAPTRVGSFMTPYLFWGT